LPKGGWIVRNPQNNLPEPLGTIIIVANFCLGIWNAYSNGRQERNQGIYQKRQQEILDILRGEKRENQD
jgi:hypothetical protein